MREKIEKDIAKYLCEGYFDVLITAFEEQQEEFPITMNIIDFMEKLKEKNIVYGLGDIFISQFIDKMQKEADRFIGR